MTAADLLLQPKAVEDALATVLRQEVVCVYDGDELRVDTPYVLQDGRLLRVYLRLTGNGKALVASDGGYATTQVEIFTRRDSELPGRYAALRGIAQELGLEWDTEFRFAAPTLDEAARRTAVLARAVDRALSTLYVREAEVATTKPAADREDEGPLPGQPLLLPSTLQARLGHAFYEAGFRVSARAKILTGTFQEPITVDYRLQRNHAEAAVGLLTAKNQHRAVIAIDHTVANFHVLHRAAYRGLLVAVYDEDSPAAQTRLLERFTAARPERALLLPGSRAVPEILERLAA